MFLNRLFRSPTVGSIADWTSLAQLFGSLFGGSLLLSWPASSIDLVSQHGWGAAFFLGLAALCGVIVIGSIGIVSWRIFRPLAKNASNEVVAAPPMHSAMEDAISQGRVHALEKKAAEDFSTLAGAIGDNGFAITDIRGKLSVLEGHVFEINERLKANPSPKGILAKLGLPEMKPPKDKFEEIERKIFEAREYAEGRSDGLMRLLEDLKQSFNNFSDKNETFTEYTKNMFRAERIMENYKLSVLQIENLGNKLDNPAPRLASSNGWHEWSVEFTEFTSNLRNLCRLIRPYIDIENSVFETPNEKYKSQNWSFDFGAMTDDQKHDYKTFRIIRSNFYHFKDGIEMSINKKLYANL